jgi:hypothetical protein
MRCSTLTTRLGAGTESVGTARAVQRPAGRRWGAGRSPSLTEKLLSFCVGEVGFADNPHVKTKLQQLSFLYKLFTKPIVAVLT